MNEPSSRRGFLQTAGAMACAVPVAQALGATDEPPLYEGEIVDAHLHLWDLKAVRLPWVEAAIGRAKDILAHDHLLADFAEATRGLNVTRAVYMEVDVVESDQVKEAEYVSRLCADAKSPMVAAVISGRPASANFAAYLDQFRGNRFIKGLRQVLQDATMPAKYCLEADFVRGVRALGERNLSFDICIRNDQLDAAADLIERCPETRFVLDHCGNPHAGASDIDTWRRGLARIAGLKDRQVICKVSGIYGNVQATDWPADRLAPIIRSVIDLFGWDRVIFSGDWPVVNLGASYRVWVDTLKQIVRADAPANQAKLFRDNALRFYGLS